MIRKLKVKFVALSMISLFALLALIIAGMNFINYNTVVSDADEVLSVLSENKGEFPDFTENPPDETGEMPTDREPPSDRELPAGREIPTGADEPDDIDDTGDKQDGGRFMHGLSAEIPYESRYFTVQLDEDGEVANTDMSRIVSVDSATAAQYAKDVLNGGKTVGFIGDFRFTRVAEDDGVRIIFLDCGRKLDAFRSFLLTSCIMALIGFAVVFVVIVFFSGRIIRPIAESYEKQKRFITDAGHEIKTPLTIINANVDVLKMEIGQNECLSDIQQQTSRLTALTNDLVSLARMEESQETMQMIEFPVSEIVQETAQPFNAPAKAQNKELIVDVQPMLSMKGDDKAIRKLVSILMDNAMKYSPEGGKISLKFARQNKSLVLSVYNTASTEIKKESLEYVFDRFYRTDLSRNSETGGHGIGLSIAKAIVTAHGGKIQASTADGRSFEITAVFPI